MDIVHSYAAELMAKFGRVDSLISHSASIGNYREEILRQFLGDVLSNRISITTGFVYDPPSKSSSRQIDILVVDENDPSAYYFKYGKFSIVKARSVVCAIEVKSSLNARTFKEIAAQAFGFRKLSANAGAFLGFCFKGGFEDIQTLGSWYSEIKDIPDEVPNYPTGIFLLEKSTLQMIAEKHAHPPGMYLIRRIDEQQEAHVLAVADFLSTVLFLCDRRAGYKSTSYVDYMTNLRREIVPSCLRYGQGLIPGEINLY